MDSVADRVVIVTGAGTGMGRSALVHFAGLGAVVVAVGRTKATLEEAVEEARKVGDEARAVVADVGTEEGAARAIGETRAAFGGLDILVNNASVGWSYETKWPGSMAATADAPRNRAAGSTDFGRTRRPRYRNLHRGWGCGRLSGDEPHPSSGAFGPGSWNFPLGQLHDPEPEVQRPFL